MGKTKIYTVGVRVIGESYIYGKVEAKNERQLREEIENANFLEIHEQKFRGRGVEKITYLTIHDVDQKGGK